MYHTDVLVLFQDIFYVTEEIEDWFPNGKNSIRIRLKETNTLPFAVNKGEDLIFTAASRNEWHLETIDSWIKSIKEKEKNHEKVHKSNY